MVKKISLCLMLCFFIASCKSSKTTTSTSTTIDFKAQQWQWLKDSLRLALAQNTCFTFDSATFSTQYAVSDTAKAQPLNNQQPAHRKAKFYGARLVNKFSAQAKHKTQQATLQQQEGMKEHIEDKPRDITIYCKIIFIALCCCFIFVILWYGSN